MTRPLNTVQTPLPTVAVLGASVVGRTLARGRARAGYPVVFGSREPGSAHIAEAIGEAGTGTPTAVRVARHDAAARALGSDRSRSP